MSRKFVLYFSVVLFPSIFLCIPVRSRIYETLNPLNSSYLRTLAAHFVAHPAALLVRSSTLAKRAWRTTRIAATTRPDQMPPSFAFFRSSYDKRSVSVRLPSSCFYLSSPLLSDGGRNRFATRTVLTLEREGARSSILRGPLGATCDWGTFRPERGL